MKTLQNINIILFFASIILLIAGILCHANQVLYIAGLMLVISLSLNTILNSVNALKTKLS